MNLGIAGSGMIVRLSLPYLGEMPITATAIFGTVRSEDRTRAMAAEHGIPNCFTDYDAFLASDIDAVYIALPNSLHFDYTKRALEAGKHVLLEKPAVCTARQWDILWQTARANHVILLEALNIHYLPAYRALKSDIPALGQLRIVCLNYSQYSSRYDAFRQGIIQPAFDPHKAGGALMDLNTYNVHTLLGLFGRPRAVHYAANIQRGIDTSGILTMVYPDFQAVCIGAKDCKAPIQCSFQGDKGSILMTNPVNNMLRYRIRPNQGEEILRDFDEGLYRLTYEFREFQRIVREADWDTAQRMAAISADAAWVQETARKQAGIRFDCDEA